MKKMLSLILAVYMSVMCCGAFVACGSVSVPTGGEKPNGETAAVYYAYDAETDEYDNVNYITLKGDVATWHGVDVSLGEVDFSGSVFYTGDEFTITVNGEFSAMDKCLMTYRGKKEDSGVLRVNSTVITKYSELVDPTVTTDTSVKYFCKKGSKPKNPVLPTELKPDNKIDGTYYHYNTDALTEWYDDDDYLVIDGTVCQLCSESDIYTGTITVTDNTFVFDSTVNMDTAGFVRFVFSGSVEKNGLLHFTRGEFFLGDKGEVLPNISDYYRKNSAMPDKHIRPVQPANPTVTLDANGGSYATGSISTLTANSDGHIILPGYKPTRKGYVFNGYNTKKDGSGATVDNNTVFMTDATVYAVWAKEVTVTFKDGNVLYKTKKVGDGMPLGDYEIPELEYFELFKGWFDGNGKQYVSYTPVNGDVTLTAAWYTGAEWEAFDEELAAETRAGHLYIHYRRKDHLVSEQGMTQINAAPYYATPINSTTYRDWAIWAWPKNGQGRAFYPMKIDMWGAVYDIDLTYEFTDCGWDGQNKTELNYTAVFNTDEIGILIFSDTSRKNDTLWANDGGNNFISKTLIDYGHVPLLQGYVSKILSDQSLI